MALEFTTWFSTCNIHFNAKATKVDLRLCNVKYDKYFVSRM